MKEVAILGVGMHPWGKWPDKTFVEYGLVAANNALKDANLKWKDIQFVAAGATRWSGMRGIAAGSTLAEEMGWTGIPVTTNYNACATGSYSMATARAYILSGMCDVALVIGMDCTPKGFFAPSETKDQFDFDYLRFKLLGQTNPSYFAMYANRRMHKYGTTEADLAMVKVKNSRHGYHNPYARFKKEYNVEEVLSSPMVAYPLRLYEICATSDGAAAVILSSLEYAKKLTSNPVTIAAISTLSPQYPENIINIPKFSTDSLHSTGSPGIYFQEAVAKKAYEEAGIGPEDLDLAEVYDLTSAYELDWYEYIGLCPRGEAERLLRNGDTTIGGKIPVNTSGGLSSFGEAPPAQGLAQVYELVIQLRGMAGKRQVEKARVGLSINFGAQGNASSVILKG